MSVDLLFKEECFAIVGICMEVHRELGPGFREAVSKDALEMEFAAQGIAYKREFSFPVMYKGQALKRRHPCDFLVYNKIILECKAATAIIAEHEAQLINYLKSAQLRLGLIGNFGARSFPFKRFVH